MSKLKLVANPTFKAKVGIPVAGGEPVEVELIFKHRTKKDLEAFIASREGKDDTDTFMEMVEGWNLDEPFNRENAETLLQNYIGAALEIFRAYLDELVKAKQKN